MDFNMYMNQEKPVNRWTIIKVGMTGFFAGVTLAVIFSWLTVVTNIR